MTTSFLDLDPSARSALWQQVAGSIDHYAERLDDLPVAPPCTAADVRAHVRAIDFNEPVSPQEAVRHVVEGLTRHHLHTGHQRSFGLFNPSPSAMGIAADALVAAFNPQLAAWSHAPWAIEVEESTLRAFADRLGYDAQTCDGTFTSGGAEANHSAVLVALTRAFPSLAREGLRSLDGMPTMYVSQESHHSFVKAARASGLGTDCVRRVPVDAHLRMDVDALTALIEDDRRAGRRPFMVVATLGTTSAGAIDDIGAIAAVAERERLWLHADAAYGGAAALVPELKPFLGDLTRADSITLDAHKWLSVPMGAGMFFTRQRGMLARAFAITTEYVPVNEHPDTVDPYAHSMQWSRRFIGLKLFMTLAVAGWQGYADVLRHQVAMASLLRERLVEAGWRIACHSPLPVICFEDLDGADPHRVAQIVNDGGEAWISATRIGTAGTPVLRACVTSFRTTAGDLDTLIHALAKARSQVWMTA